MTPDILHRGFKVPQADVAVAAGRSGPFRGQAWEQTNLGLHLKSIAVSCELAGTLRGLSLFHFRGCPFLLGCPLLVCVCVTLGDGVGWLVAVEGGRAGCSAWGGLWWLSGGAAAVLTSIPLPLPQAGRDLGRWWMGGGRCAGPTLGVPGAPLSLPGGLSPLLPKDWIFSPVSGLAWAHLGLGQTKRFTKEGRWPFHRRLLPRVIICL